MDKRLKLYIGSVLTAFVGTFLMPTYKDATFTETIGFAMVLIGSMGVGYWVATKKKETE